MGELHAVAARGAWFGNKGCLHDAGGQVVRGHRGKRWITCVTEFRGRKRELMQPGRYTELFFLDEATAYAAGHRPCAECRHAAWRGFQDRWAQQFGAAKADEIDAVLDAARLDRGRRRVHAMEKSEVPEGAMILCDGAPVLRAQGAWWRWSFDGYARASEPVGAHVALLTPWPVAQVMAAGLPVQVAGLGQ